MKPDVMVAMEGVCLTFLLVIVSAYIILPRSKDLKRDGFFYSLVFSVLGLVFDIASWASELVPVPFAFQCSVNYFALIMTNLLVSAFAYYIIDLINEKKHFPVSVGNIITAVNIIAIMITAAAGFCGRLYDIKKDTPVPGINTCDDGGFFYELPMMICILSLAVLFVIVLCNAEALGKKRIYLFIIYFMIPLTVGVLEICVEGLLLSYVAVSVSISIIYVMLQSSHISELLLRGKLLDEISYLDQLTGVLNRRAYDRDIEQIENGDTVGIVFSDLNGLKQVNDEEGHQAGDRFLITYAKILTRHFPRDIVYRISGDEFVIIQRGISAESFDNSLAGLRAEIDRYGGIASVGAATGTGDAVSVLINKAETNMYADKDDFYLHNPKRKRRKTTYMDVAE